MELRWSTCTFKINALYSELEELGLIFAMPEIIHGDPAMFVQGTHGIVMTFTYLCQPDYILKLFQEWEE